MREYEVKVNGISHTMQLSDEDVERYGATEHKAAPKSRRGKAAESDQSGKNDG